MNIWIINESIGSRIHGMVFRPYYLAKEFVRLGHKVTIFSGSYTHIYSKLPEVNGFSKCENIDGIEYCWIKTPSYSKSQSLGRIINAFTFVVKMFLLRKKRFGKPDAVIVSSPTPFSILNGYWIKKRSGAKLIFEVRDIWPLTLTEIGRLNPRHPFIRFTQFFENFSYKNSDKVVSVLSNAFEHMKNHDLTEEKYTLIPNGIDVDEAEKKTQLPADFLSLIPKDKFLIVYTGKFGISNNIEVLLEAAEKLKSNENIVFLLVGNGPEKANYQNFIVERELGNVILYDSIPKSAVQTLLQKCDVCYIGMKKLPLYRFGVSPNKIFDYLFSGKPVISAIEAANDIVADAKCGISIKSDDSDEIVKAVKILYAKTPEELVEIGRKGHEYIIKNHSYSELAKRYLEILNK